mmetsp:Transcript_14296/g.22325  ORF Transcript_14296/g.22325 Transcript_14296/m.22325 type:complete len:422 (+) Transcript_14296:88-1353(+)
MRDNRIRKVPLIILCSAVFLLITLGLRESSDPSFFEKQVDDTRRMDLTRKLKVLSLGGSAAFDDASRKSSYTSLLRDEDMIERLDNLAGENSGAWWPSICLQSMIRGGGLDSKEYDVIILEYSMSGIKGLEMLLERIRRRYPSALIIYVDVYSSESPGWSNCIGHNCRTSVETQMGLEALVKAYTGHFLTLPRPTDPMNYRDSAPYFEDDNESELGAAGHTWIAQHIKQILEPLVHSEYSLLGIRTTEEFVNGHPKPGDWLGGDSCQNWLSSGNITEDSMELQGGNMYEFVPTKFAYEITVEGHISLNTEHFEGNTQLLFIFMAKEKNYPFLDVRIDDTQTPFTIDPWNKHWHHEHTTAMQSVGVISPGRHEIDLWTKPRGDRYTYWYPFRLTGVITCVACQTLNHDIGVACRSKGCTDIL